MKSFSKPSSQFRALLTANWIILCYILPILCFANCGNTLLDPDSEAAPFKELTYTTLRDTWVRANNTQEKISFGFERETEFKHEFAWFEDFRGRYWIQGGFIGLNGHYILSSRLGQGLLRQETRKVFYQASLTDSTLMLTVIDPRYLVNHLAISYEDYIKDYSQEIVEQVLSVLQTLDFSQSPDVLGQRHEFLSWEYFGSRVYANTP